MYRTILSAAALIILIVISVYVLVTMPPVQGAYDCRISEISPDIPPEIKEKCRNLNAKAYKK
jgi:F0F1-type ATP synthase membrane subunit b/b'